METIKTECGACNSTGLYIGFTEPEGTAVVCELCSGTGCEEVRFKPFTHHKGRCGINTVSRSRGSFIVTGVGPIGDTITYQEFQQGRMP